MTEKSFTAVPNELLERIISSFTLAETRILLTTVRYTYGFHKDTAYLSTGFLAEKTGISKNNVAMCVRRLTKQRVLKIHTNATSTKAKVFGINENISQWCIQGIKNYKAE